MVPDTGRLLLGCQVIAMSKKACDITDARTSAVAITNTCALQNGSVVGISMVFYIWSLQSQRFTCVFCSEAICKGLML